MHLALIETYHDDLVALWGQQLPSCCFIEDEDAQRLLIVPDGRLRASTWVQAQTAGAVAIVAHDGRWITTESFEEQARFHPETQTYEIPRWTGQITVSPRYRDLTVSARTHSGFVHLHAHTEMSALDGLSTIPEMVDSIIADGQGAMAVTDHGVCSGHPQLQAVATQTGIKPVFGIEAYFVADRHRRGAPKLQLPTEPDPPAPFLGLKASEMTAQQKALTARWAEERTQLRRAWADQIDLTKADHAQATKAARDYQHLVLWAMTDEGLRNLWAMSTAGYREGLYYHPRIDWDVLERYNEGVMASTACLRGPLAVPLLNDDITGARHNLARLLGIFGDRLYVEIHTNDLDAQHKANEGAMVLAHELSVPTIAVVDSHYCAADDQHAHQVWLAAQTNSDISEDGDLFAGHQDYHLMTEAEVRDRLSYLPCVDEMVANTVTVADRCDAALTERVVFPIYTKAGNYSDDQARIDNDVDHLHRLARGTPEDGYANLIAKCINRTKLLDVYLDRYEREMDLLISKNFCGYYLMVWKQVRYAKDRGCLVGPGRGSGSGSLIAYLIGITTIDPVENDLLFERFLTEGRNEPPDFDVDYPTSWRDTMQDFATNEWGDDHVMRVGTHLRIKNKGVFQNLGRIFKDEVEYKDFVAIAKIIDGAEAGGAGLGISWDDLWVQHGDELEPYQRKYPKIFDLADRLRGRLKSYGRHAAGLVVSPDEVLTDNLPMRASDQSSQPISQFDMDALTMLGYIKFDILTLRTLDTLQQCIDLIEVRTGERIDVYLWTDEYDDPQVWDEVCAGNTLGIFQIETKSGTKLTRQFQPRSVADLSDVITLVRPGPVRSGITAAYLRRRDGLEDVTIPDPRLADLLAPTEGAIIYQEQVMRVCQILAGYSLEEADVIRKILGKKKVEKVQAAGFEFVNRCVERGMDREKMTQLWEQLGEFSRYAFNKSHAFAYATMGAWTAWFKFHYPVEFFTASLSTIDGKRIPEFISEARRMGYRVLPPDINESSVGFSAGALACRYGFDGIDGLSAKSAQAITEAQPYVSFNDFLERKGSAANRKVVKTLARVGAFDQMEPRRQLVERLEWEDSEEGERCQHKDDTAVGPNGLPCVYHWDEEPVEIGARGRPKKPKSPPKRCTKGCRRYNPPPEPDWSTLVDYTDAEIREMERTHLGIYLSSTPFDEFPLDVLDELSTGSDVDQGPSGEYPIAAIINSVREVTDRNGNKMAFCNMYAQDKELDVVVFHSLWSKYRNAMKVDHLCLAVIRKTQRGVNLVEFNPIHI